MEDLLEYLARQLVDEPDQVRVERTEPAPGEVRLELHVAPADLGKVIGKQGRIANALRTVAKAVAMKDKKKIYVEIVAQ